ncbi:MAG: phospholipase D family protein [Bacteroidota bacterium]|nr:phospholipase D family protein [Bacteroidota bacterium]
MEEVSFLYDQDLIGELEKLIQNAKYQLVLVSPYIDLSSGIKDSLLIQQKKKDLKVNVLFGKNDGNYTKSAKKGSLEFFMDFPDIEIRYNERLHAKFYQNDFHYIITSMNLYDFSLSKNIEIGVKGEYASKGMLLKVLDASVGFVSEGINKVKQEVIGMQKDELHPTHKFQQIFNSSRLLYKTTPILQDKKNISGFLGFKELKGKEIVHNELE